MQINSISNSNLSFGKVLTGKSVKEALSEKGCPKSLINRYIELQRSLWKANYAKVDNVDIILNYSKMSGFYGVVSSKNGEIPVKSDYYYSLDGNYDKKGFRKWVDKWNRLFAPKL